MSRRRRRWLTRGRKKKLCLLLAGMVLGAAAVAALWYCSSQGRDLRSLAEYFPFLEELLPREEVPAPAPPPVSGESLRVHILDVGQADCILIQGPERTMVIDGGESWNGPDIVQYLRAQGVDRIDYYLNTHPHSDHYGGIVQVMRAIPAGEFLHHPPPEEAVPATRGYQKLLQFLLDSGTKTTVLDPGDTIDLGGGAVLTCLAPLEEYDDLNNNSLVERLVYGNRAFLFTGDAEKKSEAAILASGAELSADVYSIPHHGSSTGVTQEFLDAVAPEYATISVGLDNDYGHPHRDTIQRLWQAEVTCLRTDLLGTIVIETDGEGLVIYTEQGQVIRKDNGSFDLVQPEP